MTNPTEILNQYSRRYPSAWEQAMMFRDARGKDLEDWPPWCFLPLSGWYSVVSAQTNKYHIGLDEANDVSVLGALGAWRYTQGVYRFHSELFESLMNTEFNGDLPADVFMRLPEWCVYIETPGMILDGHAIDGYFAFLEWDMNHKHTELRLVSVSGGQAVPMVPIYLGQWSLAEAARKALDTSMRNVSIDIPHGAEIETAIKLSPFLSPLLYICADAPEIEGHEPGDWPAFPKAIKTKKGWKLFPPNKPHVWKIGFDVGEKLRQAREAAEHQDPAKPTVRRAHVRRAHWHGYWTGPRKPKPDAPKEEQPRRFSYRWLHPMLVSGSVDDDGELN